MNELFLLILNGLWALLLAIFALWGRSMQARDSQRSKELQSLRDRMEDTCVRRDDYSSMRAEVMSRLERMDAKLDRLIERDGARNAR
jgi:Flp pilus assembly protein TadB